MSESSGQCELCFNQISSRVFPCLYHCKKMLCIHHLSEHDKYIDKQIQLQKQLENLWKNYNFVFNEEKMENQLEKLQIKLGNYRELKQGIQKLLSMNHFHDLNENDQQFQTAIQIVQKAIEHENQEQIMIHDIDPKIEFVIDNEEINQPTIDFTSLSSSIATNDESETLDSFPSMLNPNGNSPPEDDDFQNFDESDDHGNSIEMDDNEDDSSLRDETNVTLNRGVNAPRIRGYCPLFRDGAFGINSHLHGIRLCPNKSPEQQRTYCLLQHLRRFHHLTSLASLALVRAIGSGQDPISTRLFSDHDVILNIDELRTVTCPINKPFLHHPRLQIENFPCNTIKQVRHLKDHLKRVHKFTVKATNMIMKSIKADTSVQMIRFPQWIDIIENEDYI